MEKPTNSPLKSPNDVFTEEDQSALIHYGDALSKNKFHIGWRVARVLEEHEVEGDDVTADDIYNAAAKYVRASPRTVRYYTEIARRFDIPTYNKYIELYPSLSFSHFATARKRKYQENDLWDLYLHFAGEKQYAPDTAETLFDQHIEQETQNKPAAPPRKGGISNDDAKAAFFGVLRKQFGAPSLPMPLANRAMSLWRQTEMLLQDIAFYRDMRNENNEG